MKDVPFETALEKLEKIVEELERGDLSLDASLKRYEDGIKLACACQKKLSKAKEKIEILMKKDDGSLEGKPFKEADEEDQLT
ncbi:MAG: exodeoxyribonuclease VII small subunit [Candidatus Makaraimicrobium thalassicum]|nr:MAG: exodeoxyribonuclease VII small subunit [Candidatus Omnitrophota bacterium]